LHSATSLFSKQGGSQEHIYLINNSFFNDFALIIQFKHKPYLSSWLNFDTLLLQLAIFASMHSARKRIIFRLNSWISFQQRCYLLWGYYSRNSISLIKKLLTEHRTEE